MWILFLCLLIRLSFSDIYSKLIVKKQKLADYISNSEFELWEEFHFKIYIRLFFLKCRSLKFGLSEPNVMWWTLRIECKFTELLNQYFPEYQSSWESTTVQHNKLKNTSEIKAANNYRPNILKQSRFRTEYLCASFHAVIFMAFQSFLQTSLQAIYFTLGDWEVHLTL